MYLEDRFTCAGIGSGMYTSGQPPGAARQGQADRRMVAAITKRFQRLDPIISVNS
jgi:hypothetical protein